MTSLPYTPIQLVSKLSKFMELYYQAWSNSLTYTHSRLSPGFLAICAGLSFSFTLNAQDFGHDPPSE